jgi:hypothetical protein
LLSKFALDVECRKSISALIALCQIDFGVGVIEKLTKQIMSHFGMDQRAFSEALGVSLDRVKRLSSGRAEKFSAKELETLIGMGISAHWLGTGVGPMLQSEAEKRLTDRLAGVKKFADDPLILALPKAKQGLLKDLLYAVELGAHDVVVELLTPWRQITAEQNDLLDNLEHCSKEDQDTIRRIALLAAKADSTGN